MRFARRFREQTRAWFVLCLAAAMVVSMLAGLAYMLLATVSGTGATHKRTATSRTPGGSAAPSSPAPTIRRPAMSLAARQDELAERPMLRLPPSAAKPQPLVAATAGPPIVIPAATNTSEPVPSGFPKTPEGALGQLAAIDTAALAGLDREQARQVHAWAATSGAVTIKEWTPAVAVEAALSGAGQPDGAPELTSIYTPLAGQIKGGVGDSFVVACVLGEWQVSYRSSSRAGIGDCQRMVWLDGRWRIGPGAQPAYAPSAWPGSANAVRAGWRPLTHA